MLEKLWKDIQLIYDGFNFSRNLLINDLMIVSQDNCYLLHYKTSSNDDVIQVRIEKNYNLVRIWGGDVPYDMVNYKIHAEKGNQISSNEDFAIELTYKIITPFLREAKLKQIGV